MSQDGKDVSRRGVHGKIINRSLGYSFRSRSSVTFAPAAPKRASFLSPGQGWKVISFVSCIRGKQLQVCYKFARIYFNRGRLSSSSSTTQIWVAISYIARTDTFTSNPKQAGKRVTNYEWVIITDHQIGENLKNDTIPEKRNTLHKLISYLIFFAMLREKKDVNYYYFNSYNVPLQCPQWGTIILNVKCILNVLLLKLLKYFS